MSDDWRIRVDLSGTHRAHELAEQLRSGAVEHELTGAFADKVIVSVDGDELFAYAGSREQAQAAGRVIERLAAGAGAQISTELKRWHPAAEEWGDADAPLPSTDAERAAERAELMAQERQQAEAKGYPEWEVRVQCDSHGETVKLAEVLRSQSLPVVQRWRYLLIGVEDEDTARSLATRITQECPPGTTVTVEGTLAEIAAEVPPSPFSVLTGIWG